MGALAALLAGPRLKIQRAREHIRELDARLGDFLRRRPFRLMVRQEVHPPARVIFVEVKQTIPETLSLIAGDAVHNLRTALDFLAFALAAKSAPSPDRVAFPFAKDAASLRDVMAAKQLNTLPEQTLKAIEALGPYPGGNEWLYALHELDARDKHRLILAVARVSSLTADQVASLTGANIRGQGVLEFADDLSELIRVQLAVRRRERRALRQFTQEAEIQPKFDVAFGKGQSFAGKPLVDVLERAAFAVDEAVEFVARAHLDSGAPAT